MFFKFFLLFISFAGCVEVSRLFIYENTFSTEIQTILDYFSNTNEQKLVPTKIVVNNATLNELFKTSQKNKEDTIFAYLPSADFNMINELAKMYEIYIWNAVEYADHICYSNIVFGYDISESGIECIVILIIYMK